MIKIFTKIEKNIEIKKNLKYIFEVDIIDENKIFPNYNHRFC